MTEIPPGRSPAMARRPPRRELSAAQQAEAERLLGALRQAAEADLRALAEQLATTTDETLFGANEFAVRDIVLGLGATALQTALAERKRGGTAGPASAARPVAGRPSSSGGKANPS